MFIAGDPRLDLLNSIETPVDRLVEWLPDGKYLIAWLEQSELVTPEAAAAWIRDKRLPVERLFA
jgi:hypothetical protein